MSLTSAAIRFAAKTPQVESFQRYLFIGPHPDDIEIGAGATAAVLAAAGKDVCFVIAADGRYGRTEATGGLSTDGLIALRRDEALRSAAALGVTDVRFLDLPDGGGYTPAELFDGLARVAGGFKPELIFAPDPCVTSECHADHLNVGEAARRLAFFAPFEGVMAAHGAESAPVKAIAFYMTAKPNRFVATGKYFRRQLNAVFDNHLSQFPTHCGEARAIELYLTLRSVDFGIRSLKGRAEGFRVLGATQMHCLPEAGK